MSARRSFFLLSFLILSAVSWAAGIQPALKERRGYLDQMRNVEQTRAANQRKISQSAELEQAWMEFGSLAQAALEDLEDHLNPALIQKRITAWASQAYDCDVRVKQELSKPKDAVLYYSMIGEGDYSNLVRYLDALERGDFRIRFTDVKVILPSKTDQRAGKVVLHATFVIPKLPDAEVKAETSPPVQEVPQS
ncbi:MAG: hypothetical protein DWQ01_19990 [Planctomycetota bacterium]|nr:MAG: hypothetical protein DWQ01_19990 [Planctomycetota bacterium]